MRHGRGPDAGASGAEKAQLRARLLAARATLGPGQCAAAAERLHAAAVGAPELAGARTVAAYVAVGAEPATARLLDTLRARGVRVLLPVLLADGDLDWAAYDGPSALTAAPRGLREPTGPRLGVDALAAADVALVPGLAADRHGARLGRGGGSYDRALARVGGGTWTAVLLHDGEVLERVPSEPHDVEVAAAITPSGVIRLGRARRP